MMKIAALPCNLRPRARGVIEDMALASKLLRTTCHVLGLGLKHCVLGLGLIGPVLGLGGKVLGLRCKTLGLDPFSLVFYADWIKLNINTSEQDLCAVG